MSSFKMVMHGTACVAGCYMGSVCLQSLHTVLALAASRDDYCQACLMSLAILGHKDIQTQYSPSCYLLTTLVSPKDMKCKLID